MITNELAPLAIASKVLKVETLRTVARQPFNRFGWSILDRWAFDTPTALQALEEQGLAVLRARLLEQQEQEVNALLALSPVLGNSVPNTELLACAELQTTLA